MARSIRTIITSTAAVGYCRCSTDEQADSGLSLDNQRDRIAAYCASAGLDLVDIVSDAGVSGGKALDNRPGGVEVLTLLSAGTARHVVALKLDRLFRDTCDALATVKTWDETGVGLHLVDHGGQSINTSSAVGRMFLTMLAGFAEFERGMIRERTSSAMAAKRARGEVISRPTLGYDRDGKQLVVNDDEQALIARMVEMRAGGQSFHVIAATLNSEGVPGKRGGLWFAATVQKILERASR